MTTFIDSAAQWMTRVSYDAMVSLGIPGPGAEFIIAFILGLVLFLVCAGYAIMAGYIERKYIGRIHSRIGPMYTGPAGILQTAADALKFIRKEVIFPVGSDRVLFTIAPVLMILTHLAALAFVPLGSYTPIATPYGLIIVIAILSLTPIGILVGSWASNSKYSTLGGLRSAGLTMAYEVLLAVAIASVILTTHSMSITEIVGFQDTHGVWLLFLQPLAFALFFIAAVASVERNPLDLTEAESELVNGWRTEYGGVYFSLTLLAEYIKLLVMCILLVVLFMGGWSDWTGEIGFILKIVALTVLMIAIRATAMRYRMDQLLHDLWTRLIPLAFINIIVTIIVLRIVGGA
jgi:NADH-quinone oxidoreductase subunit H